MTLFNKIKWVLGIALIFLLILTTNLVDRQNFTAVRDSIETIYADRLVAQEIIYEITKGVNEKEIGYAQLVVGKSKDDLSPADDRIEEAIERFSLTKLTQQEAIVFAGLKSSLQLLRNQEQKLGQGPSAARLSEVRAAIESVKKDLDDLSAIQVREGRRQLFEGKKALSSADLFTQLEIGALVVLAIAVQVVILYTPGMIDEPIDYGDL